MTDHSRQPDLRPIGDGLFILNTDFIYEWKHQGENYKIVIPKGFITDIASVPRWFWIFGFTPDGLHRAAALAHDFLYRYNKPSSPKARKYLFKMDSFGLWQDISDYPWSRKQCDRLFCRIMKDYGTGSKKRWLMFKAVRLFGWLGWR